MHSLFADRATTRYNMNTKVTNFTSVSSSPALKAITSLEYLNCCHMKCVIQNIIEILSWNNCTYIELMILRSAIENFLLEIYSNFFNGDKT